MYGSNKSLEKRIGSNTNIIVSCPNSYADVIITHIDFFEISTKQMLKS